MKLNLDLNLWGIIALSRFVQFWREILDTSGWYCEILGFEQFNTVQNGFIPQMDANCFLFVELEIKLCELFTNLKNSNNTYRFFT